MNINSGCFITFFLLVFALIIVMNNIYSKNGDIKTLTNNFNYNELEKEYNDKNKILSQLHNLFVYKNNYVYWIYYLFIAIIASLLINLIVAEIYKVPISFVSVFSITVFIFITLEVPRRFINAHFEKISEIEGIQLLNLLKNKYL